MYGRERGIIVDPSQEAIGQFYKALFKQPRLGDVLNLYETAVRVIRSTEINQEIVRDRIYTLACQAAIVAEDRENTVLLHFFGEQARKHQKNEGRVTRLLETVEGL